MLCQLHFSDMVTKGNQKLEQTDIHQKFFDDIKRIMNKKTILNYPKFDRPFDIHTDASHRQLGVIICQDGKPLALYFRQISGTVDLWSELLAPVAWVTSSIHHNILNVSAAHLVFGQDILLNVKFISDLEVVRIRKQQNIEKIGPSTIIQIIYTNDITKINNYVKVSNQCQNVAKGVGY